MTSRGEQSAKYKRPIRFTAASLLAVLCFVVFICYRTAPTGNTQAKHFDVILVLGTPASRGGQITRRGAWLMQEAAREYKAGVAERIVVSGGAVANHFVEADVLARYAQNIGVPASAVLEEREAHNTLQNVRNTEAIMTAHGWHSAEVIGLREHLPRAGMLLTSTSLEWHTHAAATPGRGLYDRVSSLVAEALGTSALRIFGLWTVPVLHAIKVGLGLPRLLLQKATGKV